MTKEENILLIRSYLQNPVRWPDIIQTMKDNIHQLNEETQQFYEHATRKQLKERLTSKIGKLMKIRLDAIEEDDLR